MDNLNNGSIVEFSQIEDYQKAAKDFAEGNRELEQLLLNCFSKGIKTIACCGGHEDKNRKPYISFSYSSENEQLIYAIISKLKDSGFNFRYNKRSNGKSFFSIEEGQSFDFSKASTLFNDINDVVNSFDIKKDYYAELPRDLQKYSSIIKTSETDEFLKIDGTANYFQNYFQMCYEKVPDGYEYSMFATDPYYNSIAEKENFTKISMMGMVPSYNLKVPNREMAIQGLNGIATNIQIFGNKQAEISNLDQSQPTEPKEDELEIGFEYDERTRSNPLINHLKVNSGDTIEIVAQKLRACRGKGINAFAVFNGVEVNNYKSDDPQQIIEEYNQSRNKSGEMEIKKMINQGEEIRANQQSIETVGQDLTHQNKAYEHFIHMRDTQRQQDQLIRQQQLGQLSQQDVQQMGGMAR